MQGWAQFKQGRLEDGLRSFFGVLDLKLGDDQAMNRKGQDDSLARFSRADRELLEDTLRVTSLSLANLQGAASIAPLHRFARARGLPVPHLPATRCAVHQARPQQGRGRHLRRLHAAQPLHAQAPQMQARVIEIYERGGFANQALQAKKDYVSRYGIDSEFSRANPEGWEAAQPLLKTHLAELARHHHAAAQASKASADYAEAVRWYRIVLKTFPDDPTAAQSNFLLAELLFEDKQFADASREYERAAYDYPRMRRAPMPVMPHCWPMPSRKRQPGLLRPRPRLAPRPASSPTPRRLPAATRCGQRAALSPPPSRPTRAPRRC